MQPGHTISNQKIILTFTPTNCTYIVTIKLWYCSSGPWADATLQCLK